MHKFLSRLAVPSFHSACCCMTVYLSWWAYRTSELVYWLPKEELKQEATQACASLAIREARQVVNK